MLAETSSYCLPPEDEPESHVEYTLLLAEVYVLEELQEESAYCRTRSPMLHVLTSSFESLLLPQNVPRIIKKNFQNECIQYSPGEHAPSPTPSEMLKKSPYITVMNPTPPLETAHDSPPRQPTHLHHLPHYRRSHRRLCKRLPHCLRHPRPVPLSLCHYLYLCCRYFHFYIS